ncbi:MAG: hypothetical protein IPL14_02700 [Nitrospira sp.]|nr:hypothetical protein [Nitrospira sp.]
MPPMRLNSARVTRACLQASGLAVLGFALSLCPVALSSHAAWAADGTTESELQIDITKIGLGKEVVITQGKKEWFMRVEVTPENSVVVRQEKMTPAEVDVAIADFVNSVKTRQKVQ